MGIRRVTTHSAGVRGYAGGSGTTAAQGSLSAVVFGFYACTACSVDRLERRWNEKAQEALQKEWDRLRACGEHGCSDELHPRERSDVEDEARKQGQVAHFGTVFDICLEKSQHLPEGSLGRKFKGRAVYQGNNVKDQDGNLCHLPGLGVVPIDDDGFEGRGLLLVVAGM